MKPVPPRPGTLDAGVGAYVLQLRRDLLRIAAGSRPLWLRGWEDGVPALTEPERRVWVSAADDLARDWEAWRAAAPRTSLATRGDVVPARVRAEALQQVLQRTIAAQRRAAERDAVGLRYTYRAVESALHEGLVRVNSR